MTNVLYEIAAQGSVESEPIDLPAGCSGVGISIERKNIGDYKLSVDVLYEGLAWDSLFRGAFRGGQVEDTFGNIIEEDCISIGFDGQPVQIRLRVVSDDFSTTMRVQA